MTTLMFTKTRKVKSPTRATKKSAGIDFFVPEFDDDFIKDLITKNDGIEEKLWKWGKSVDNKTVNSIMLMPHQRILIPSGIHVNIPHNYALIVHNKSGVATKKGLDRLAEVVDEDYQGEIHLSVVNTSNDVVCINENEKLVQLILIPVLYADIKEVSTLEELYPTKTQRGTGGFGSTGE